MNPTFKITMENGGVIEGELYPEKAPQSVANFIDLCNHNYYRSFMARSICRSPNPAGSQFFIMHQDAKHLDGQYAAFGKVTSGMEVVDAIAAVKTDRNDRPQEEQKVASITVDTHGESYEAPKKLPDPYGRF